MTERSENDEGPLTVVRPPAPTYDPRAFIAETFLAFHGRGLGEPAALLRNADTAVRAAETLLTAFGVTPAQAVDPLAATKATVRAINRALNTARLEAA